MNNEVQIMDVEQVQDLPVKSDIAVSKQDPMLDMIERIATNPKVDITKMQALLDMRNQELARVKAEAKEAKDEAKKEAFDRAFVEMKPHLPRIAKTKKNDQTHSSYAPLEDINEQVDPILVKYGFATSANVLSQKDGMVIVECELLHKEGYSKKCVLDIPLDNVGAKGTVNKTDIHATASSITYGKRIGICALLNISIGDDKDGNKPQVEELATDSQRQMIAGLFAKMTTDHQEKFSAIFGGVAEIKKKHVTKALNKINTTLKAYEESK